MVIEKQLLSAPTMGEAKRRKQLDTNYGNSRFNYKIQKLAENEYLDDLEIDKLLKALRSYADENDVLHIYIVRIFEQDENNCASIICACPFVRVGVGVQSSEIKRFLEETLKNPNIEQTIQNSETRGILEIQPPISLIPTNCNPIIRNWLGNTNKNSNLIKIIKSCLNNSLTMIT